MAVATDGGGNGAAPKKPRQTKQGVKPKTLTRSGHDTTSESGAASNTNEGYGPGPVSVYATRDVYKPAVTAAIKLWNKQVGFTVFKLINTPKTADVVVTLGNTEKRNAVGLGVPGAWTPSGRGHVILDEKTYSAHEADQIRADNPNWDEAAYVQEMGATVQHELGHAIGLAHPGPSKNPYEYNKTGYGTKGSGIMGSSQYAAKGGLDAGGVPVPQTGGLSTYSERDLVAQLREEGQANFYQRGRIAKQTGTEVDDLSNITEDQWRRLADTPPPFHYDGPGGGGGGDTGGGSGGSSSGSGSSGSGSSSGSSSSSSTSAPPVDPRIAQLESLFRSAYIQLWGEPPTEAYVKQAAHSGMNVTEFVHRERMKNDWQFTKAYKDEAKGLFDLIRQMGVA